MKTIIKFRSFLKKPTNHVEKPKPRDQSTSDIWIKLPIICLFSVGVFLVAINMINILSFIGAK